MTPSYLSRDAHPQVALKVKSVRVDSKAIDQLRYQWQIVSVDRLIEKRKATVNLLPR